MTTTLLDHTTAPNHPATDAQFAEIVDSLTRRGFLGGVVGAATLAGLSACSAGDQAPSPSPSAATRIVDSAKGKIEVPADPRRIVVLAPQPRDTLYDLGITPVGVYDEGSEYISPRYRTKMGQSTTIGTGSDGLALEKIATLQPDLIIGVDYEYNTDSYRKLTDLAPTVIAPASTWQAISHATADAVDKLGMLTSLEQQFDAKAAGIKTQYADVLDRYRWDILQGGYNQGQFWLYGPKSDAGLILAAAGVRFASASAKVPGADNKAISYENIDVLSDADVIGFYSDYDNAPNNKGPQLFAQAGFKALPAAKAGRTIPIPDFLPNGYGDAIAVLDELEAGLKKLAVNK